MYGDDENVGESYNDDVMSISVMKGRKKKQETPEDMGVYIPLSQTGCTRTKPHCGDCCQWPVSESSRPLKQYGSPFGAWYDSALPRRGEKFAD